MIYIIIKIIIINQILSYKSTSIDNIKTIMGFIILKQLLLYFLQFDNIYKRLFNFIIDIKIKTNLVE